MHTLTFVIVLAVATIQFKRYTAIRTIPALVAAALPLSLAAYTTLTMRRTAIRTAFDGAVLAIPTGHTQTGAVLALAMLVAARIAELSIAVFAAPLGIASAGIADTAPMLTAIQIA